MSNDDSFRGGPKRPGGGFRPRGDGPRPSRPAGPPRDGGDRPRKPFFRDGDAPRGPRRDFGDAPKRDFSAGPRRDGDAPRGPRRDFGDAPKRDFSAGPRREGDAPRGPRRDFGDGPKRDFGGPRREGGDAPRRSFDGPRDFRRDGDAPRGPRRDFGDAPKRDFSAGPRREGGDAPRRSFDGPRDFRRDGDAPRGPRRDFGDGPKRDFSAGPRREGGDAPRRSFDGPRDFRRDGDAPRGPRRDFGDGPKRDFSAGPRREGGDAPRRSFDGPRDFRRDGEAPRGPRRDFGNGPKRDFGGPRREGGDAPRRSFDGPRDFRRDGDAPRGPRRDFNAGPRSDAPRHSHDTPRETEAPARGFFRHSDEALVAAIEDTGATLQEPVLQRDDPGNDDWEVPLGGEDGDAQDATVDAWPVTDADRMTETDTHAPVEAPSAVEDSETAAAPLAAPVARFAESARRESREPRWSDDRRAPERPESQGFDTEARRAQRQRELRIHGLNACLAVVRDRREAVRKVYLRGDRAEAFAGLLEWCRNQHLAYRYVTDSELSALTGSEHHEGICLEIERKPWLAFETLLQQLKTDHGPKVLLLLDGVGNPHNIGGILRAAAHFGVHALLLPPDSALQLSAATYRTAEGGAELIPIVKLRETSRDLEALGALDFHVIGSFPREATSIYTTRWPERTVLVIGAEQNGIRPATAEFCDRRFTIPGSGAVESLNAATATAVLLSAYAGSLAREAWAASKA